MYNDGSATCTCPHVHGLALYVSGRWDGFFYMYLGHWLLLHEGIHAMLAGLNNNRAINVHMYYAAGNSHGSATCVHMHGLALYVSGHWDGFFYM